MEPVQRKITEPQNILPGDFVYLCKPGTDVIVGFTVGTATHGNGSHCYTPKTSLTRPEPAGGLSFTGSAHHSQSESLLPQRRSANRFTIRS